MLDFNDKDLLFWKWIPSYTSGRTCSSLQHFVRLESSICVIRYLVKENLWNKYGVNSLTKVLLGVHCGLNHTSRSGCGGSVWECVWRCVLPGRACICILLLLGAAPHSAFPRQEILYIHIIFTKKSSADIKGSYWLSVFCPGSCLIIQQYHRRWLFHSGSKFWGLQLHQRTAAPMEAGTVCGFIPRHSASRQSLIIVPFLLPRLPNPPPPHLALPAAPADWDASWLRCFH